MHARDARRPYMPNAWNPYLMKQLEQINVVGFLPEVQLKDFVDGGFNEKCVIDCHHAHFFLLPPLTWRSDSLVPARLLSARDRCCRQCSAR